MLAALLLAGALAWLCIALAAGWLALRRSRKRWVQVAVTLFVLWLPFWDVIPGLYFYYKAVREVGGVRIYKTVQAEGYLDRTATDCYSCWSRLNDFPYRYIEIQRTVPYGALMELEKQAGFYRYSFAPIGDPACGPFESLQNGQKLRNSYNFSGNCLVTVFQPTPFSRYEYQSETARFPEGAMYRPVLLFLSRAVNTETGDILGEACIVHFESWLGQWLGLPGWSFVNDAAGNPIRLSREIIIKPLR